MDRNKVPERPRGDSGSLQRHRVDKRASTHADARFFPKLTKLLFCKQADTYYTLFCVPQGITMWMI